MYSCDLCGIDTASPEDLTRVHSWYQFNAYEDILVCFDCLEGESKTVERLEEMYSWFKLEHAEDDTNWEYGSYTIVEQESEV